MHHRPAATVPGKVYVLRSGRYPAVHKVGRTAWHTEWRAEQLANEPGYRGFAPFLPVYEIAVDDTVAVEAGAHRRLDRRRIVLRCGSRELFRATEDQCCRAVQEAAMEVEAHRRIAAVWGRGSPLPPPVGGPPPATDWLTYAVAAVAAAIFLLWAL